MHALFRIASPFALAILPAAHALDMPHTQVPMETCLKAVMEKVPGQVTRLKLEMEDGKPTYEFKVAGKDRSRWEVECDATTGTLGKVERKASRNDREFSAAAKIVEADARKIALQRQPGKVTGSELEFRNDRPVYEIEIQGADGKEVEVNVDAVTGEIIGVEHESEEKTVYEIGEE